MKVLVIDDEQDISWLFSQKFRKEIKDSKLQFVFAISAEEGLKILEMEGTEIHSIFTDLNMPGMTGFELLKRVKSDLGLSNKQVYVMSAYSDSENVNLAKELGALVFITKPIDFTLIKDILL